MATCAFVTLAMAAIVVMVLQAELKSDDHLLYRYQTLIATAVAFLTVVVIYWQASNERRRHKDELKSLALYARATLPSALLEISTYADKVASWIVNPADWDTKQPDSEIRVLVEASKHLPPNVSERISKLSAWYQIHNDRFAGFRVDQLKPNQNLGEYPEDWQLTRIKPNKLTQIRDTARLQVLVTSLYAESRADVYKYEGTAEEWVGALKACLGEEYYRNEEIYNKALPSQFRK